MTVQVCEVANRHMPITATVTAFVHGCMSTVGTKQYLSLPSTLIESCCGSDDDTQLRMESQLLMQHSCAYH